MIRYRPRGQFLYPVVDDQKRLAGVLTRQALTGLLSENRRGKDALAIRQLMNPEPTVAYPDEPLRVVVSRMADKGLTRFPVVERGSERKLLGMISLEDLLRARTRALAEERDRGACPAHSLAVSGRIARQSGAHEIDCLQIAREPAQHFFAYVCGCSRLSRSSALRRGTLPAGRELFAAAGS